MVEFPSNERDEEFDFLVKKLLIIEVYLKELKKKWKMRQEMSDFRKKIQLADSDEDAQLIAYELHAFLKTLPEDEQTAFKENVKARVKSKLNVIGKLFETFEAVRQDHVNFA